MDVVKAIDQVWHEELNLKLKMVLPVLISEILYSYMTEKYFRTKQEDTYSELREILAGIPQKSVLGLVLYLLYTSDLLTFEQYVVATFANDTAIMAVGDNVIETTEKLQATIIEMQKWTNKWGMKLNELKSIHVYFTNKKIEYRPVYINHHAVPRGNTAKYLDMTLHVKLRWKAHVKKKQELN